MEAPSSGISDVGYLPYSFLAADALAEIVENPPVKKEMDAALYTKQDIKMWQDWWESHQHEYP
jgi:hypothetical protein